MLQKYVFGFYYHSVKVISYVLAQRYHIKRCLLLYYFMKCKTVFIKVNYSIKITSTLSVAAATQK